MEGKISFNEALIKRLLLFKTNRDDLKKLIDFIKKNVTPSVKNNKEFFENFSESIYIVSGGFREFITPVVKEYGIKESHVLANTFIFDNKDRVIGFDTKNPLSNNGGKIAT